MSKASADVLAERQRQIDAEGYTPDHDDQHDDGELAKAAMAHAQSSFEHADADYDDYAFWWPFDSAPMKRKPPREALVKAAALLIAEIERMDRA